MLALSAAQDVLAAALLAELPKPKVAAGAGASFGMSLPAELPKLNGAAAPPASLAAPPASLGPPPSLPSKIGAGAFLCGLPSPCAAGALVAAASGASADGFGNCGATSVGAAGFGGAMLTAAGVELKILSSARIVAAARCILYALRAS